MAIPSQCRLCINFNTEESLCRIYEQLPGEYGREDVKDCPSFLEKGTKDANDLTLLIEYLENEEGMAQLEMNVSKAVDRILNDYQSKYKVLIVGIARRKIRSIIKMVDIVDTVLDKLGERETLEGMPPSQAIRLLSELNHSMNNDLSFIMKLVNPDTKFQDLQMWIDARSTVNISGSSEATEMKASEAIRLSGASRDKVREAFDALLYKIASDDNIIEVQEQEEIEDE